MAVKLHNPTSIRRLTNQKIIVYSFSKTLLINLIKYEIMTHGTRWNNLKTIMFQRRNLEINHYIDYDLKNEILEHWNLSTNTESKLGLCCRVGINGLRERSYKGARETLLGENPRRNLTHLMMSYVDEKNIYRIKI